MSNNEKKTSKEAQKAESLAKKLTDDMKLAVDAMQRTIRHRRTRISVQDRYTYEQIK